MVAKNPPSAIIIVLKVRFFVYDLNYVYLVTFRKNTRPARVMHAVHIYVSQNVHQRGFLEINDGATKVCL